MSFHVGQKVVCVDATSITYHEKGSELVEGHIYTVREVGITVRNMLGLRLQEQKLTTALGYWSGRPHTDAFYRASRFRPVQERKTDTGMAILRKVADDAAKRKNLVVTG